MKVFEFGLELGVGFCIPVAAFCLCAAIAVVGAQEVSYRRRQRMINEGLYELGGEDAARRQGDAGTRGSR